MRDKLTYANVMATVAVFLALGGVGYAASGLADQNSDEDFPLWDGRTYSVKKTIDTNGPQGDLFGAAVYCDTDDPQIGGGFVGLRPELGKVYINAPVKKFPPESSPSWNPQGWNFRYADAKPSVASGVQVVVRCADFGDRH